MSSEAPDFPRIRNNVRKMIQQGATERELDMYLGHKGVTPDDLRRAGRVSALEEKTGGRRGSFFDRAAQSALFNMQDEWHGVVAGAGALFTDETVGDAYSRARDGYRDRQELYEIENPNAAVVADVVGALVPVGPAAAMRGATMAGRMGRAAATGATYGAVSGFGAGEGAGDRFGNAATGAAVGGAVGAALPPLLSGGRAVGAGAWDAIRGRTDPRGFAAEKVSQALTRDKRGPGALASRMMADAAQTGQRTTMADVGGENTRRLLDTAAIVPSEGANSITTRLNLRAMGQGDRIRSILSGTLKDPAAYGQTVDDLVARRSQQAAPFYNRAYANPITFTPRLEEILKRPSAKRALSQAQRIADDEGVPFQQLFGRVDTEGNIVDVRRVPDMRAWDYIKRGLDDIVERDAQEFSEFGARKLSAGGRAVDGIRKSLLAELDRLNPDYGKARRVALDNIMAQEALEFGRRAFRMTPEQVRRKFTGLNDSQREVAQMGFAEAMRDIVDSAGFTHNALNRVMKNRNQIAVVKAMFGENMTEYAKFMRGMMNEARMRRTYDTVRGNSRTMQRAAALNDAGALGEAASVATSAASGGMFQAALQFIGQQARGLGGFTPDVATEVQRILLNSDPKVAVELSRELARVSAARMNREQARAAVRQALSAAIGIQTDEFDPSGQN